MKRSRATEALGAAARATALAVGTLFGALRRWRMTVLTRYVSTEFGKLLASSFLGFGVLFLSIDVVDRLGKFLEHDAPTGLIVEYFLCRVPELVFQMIPVAMLVATTVTVGRLSQLNELTAIKAGGVSLYRALVVPIGTIGLGVSLLCMGVNELLVPWANARADEIYYVEVRGREPYAKLDTTDVWLQTRGHLVYARELDPRRGKILGLTAYRLDEGFRPVSRLDAGQARWLDNGRWRLRDVVERDLVSGTIAEAESRKVAFGWSPEDFQMARPFPTDQMSFFQLRRHIRAVEGAGYDGVPYRTDLHGKVAFPFVCLLVPLVAIPFAAVPGRQAGIAGSLVLSLVVAVAYFFLHSFAISMGRAGRLSPLVAAWITNLLFVLVGGYRLLNLRQ